MTSRQDFFEFILDHYENPRHRGILSAADVVMKGGNPGCGDVVTIYLRIDPESQQIEDISFTGEGCTISQAAASLTMTKIQGQTLAQVHTLRAQDILTDLGESVLRTRRRCATLALHTLRAALTRYLQSHPGLPAPSSDADEPALGLHFEPQPGTEE
ncbi:MAG: iron-sulfur cluster assembly scaffold protein [Ardenticatenales bacterium]|nr:iron-sulfur cluster assembly scaffold protein [Ardenticatenales bacterium]